MVQLGCFFHQNISFTLKIGGRIESKIKVKMYAQEDTAVILIIRVIKNIRIKIFLILPPPHNKPKYELLIRLSKSYILYNLIKLHNLLF